jgi:hypothetical protein
VYFFFFVFFFSISLPELVSENINGKNFETSTQLSTLICELFQQFPKQNQQVDILRQGAMKWAKITWTEQWKQAAEPLLNNSKPPINTKGKMFILLVCIVVFSIFYRCIV